MLRSVSGLLVGGMEGKSVLSSFVPVRVDEAKVFITVGGERAGELLVGPEGGDAAEGVLHNLHVGVELRGCQLDVSDGEPKEEPTHWGSWQSGSPTNMRCATTRTMATVLGRSLIDVQSLGWPKLLFTERFASSAMAGHVRSTMRLGPERK